MAGSPFSHRMTAQERRATVFLALIYATRMFGLFCILPVFALHAQHLTGYSVAWAGFALGAYGLSQAVLQIPFGVLSDRWGARPVIIGGLVLFAVGSVVAAVATDMLWMIVGRLVQGSGAIAAAVMALAADLTREEQRSKAMAAIGISIGLSFAVSIVLGPWLAAHWGVPSLFWMTSVLALVAIAVLQWGVPRETRHPTAGSRRYADALRNGQLWRLNGGIFVLHALLTALFTVFPLLLRDQLGVSQAEQGQWYLGAMALSLCGALPLMGWAERRQRVLPVYRAAIVTLLAAFIGFVMLPISSANLFVLLCVFFAGFNVLEAILPSLVSRMAPAELKGTALGVYSTSQFLGAFVGGTVAGGASLHWGAQGVFVASMLLALGWLGITYGQQSPRYLRTRVLRLHPEALRDRERLAERIAHVAGISEVALVDEEGIAYLKVDIRMLDMAAVQQFGELATAKR
jgi:predicted MFS family arabinose efflux permease